MIFHLKLHIGHHQKHICPPAKCPVLYKVYGHSPRGHRDNYLDVSRSVVFTNTNIMEEKKHMNLADWAMLIAVLAGLMLFGIICQRPGA